MFANLGDKQLRCRLVARKADFDVLHRAFRGSLFSLHDAVVGNINRGPDGLSEVEGAHRTRDPRVEAPIDVPGFPKSNVCARFIPAGNKEVVKVR